MKENLPLPPGSVECKKFGIVKLFELSSEEISLLRQSIDENNGKIRVFVHPFYSRINGYTFTGYEPRRGHNSQSDFAINGFLKVVFSKNTKNTPIFIFEEGKHLEDMLNAFKKNIDKLYSNLVLIPTKENESTPLTPWFLKDEDSFKFINDFFLSVGVKEILVGGMNLSISSPDNAGRQKMEQCVAQFLVHSNFPCKLSNYLYPNDGRDIENAILSKK